MTELLGARGRAQRLRRGAVGGGHPAPDEVIELLTTRLATLDKANAAQQADLKQWVEMLPRVLLIEAEYQLAMRVAQSKWLRGLLTELVEGTISGIESGGGECTRPGRCRPSSRSWDELGRRRWEETSPDVGTRPNRPGDMDTTPVHGAATPRTVVEITTSPAVRQNRRS